MTAATLLVKARKIIWMRIWPAQCHADDEVSKRTLKLMYFIGSHFWMKVMKAPYCCTCMPEAATRRYISSTFTTEFVQHALVLNFTMCNS